jgi:hypothetical protein
MIPKCNPNRRNKSNERERKWEDKESPGEAKQKWRAEQIKLSRFPRDKYHEMMSAGQSMMQGRNTGIIPSLRDAETG